MKKIITLLIFVLYVQLVFCQSIHHNVDWERYIENIKSAPETGTYFFNLDYGKKLSLTGANIENKEWELVTDSATISLLSKIDTSKVLSSLSVFEATDYSVIKGGLVPFKVEADNVYKLKGFDIVFVESNVAVKSSKVYKNHSVLASGKWIKVYTTDAGVLKLSYSKLKEMGISDPANVAVYGNGGYMVPKMNSVDYPDDLNQIPVIHQKDKNGQECIFFYSSGTTSWNFDSAVNMFVHNINLYSDTTFFYLSSDVAQSPSPQSKQIVESSPDVQFKTYDALDYREVEKNNLISSGRRWFDEIFVEGSKKTYSFDFPNAILGKEAKISIVAAGRCTEKSWFSTRINSVAVDSVFFGVTYNGSYQYASEVKKYYKVSAKTNMRVELSYGLEGDAGQAWLDYITLNVPSSLSFSSDQLVFQNAEARSYNIISYSVSTTNSNAVVWDVTNPLKPMVVSTSVGSSEITFNDFGGSIKQYVVFDPSKGTFSEPKLSGSIGNQDIHGQPSCDMLIVTHPNFLTPSKALAEFHEKNDDMKVLVFTTDEVFNEFSSGLPDVAAIRNLARMFYDRSKYTGNPLKYLLLMGDGSYDNRDEGNSKSNYIPTYQSDNSLSEDNSLVTDDFFGLLDENEGETTGALDIGIGRIPCKTKDEADIVLNKITNYSSSKSLGNWRNTICFIADDQDNGGGNEYINNSEELISLITDKYPGFFTDKIYLDSYQQATTSYGFAYPDVNRAINQRVEDGALILNYVGHGSPQSLAHEKILEISDINSWSNINSLPIFVTATCEFGRFDKDEEASAAEQILMNPTGGGIGLFTTTRVVYSIDNQVLSRSFYDNIFDFDQKGEKLRLGDAFKNAKNASNTGANENKFSLFADPALRLAFPKYSVVTNSINETTVDEQNSSVSVGALGKVTIKGQVNDFTGSLLSTFNGEVSTTVYDKEISVETLGNDGYQTVQYNTQNNIIYKGTSTVKNGEFEVTFIVPKDITYNVGAGKIIYYVSDGKDDGNGSTDKIKIGGTSANPIVDNDAPEIELFMNDEDFESNDKVSTSALLLVKLFDESGINTVGTGIGHDLVAVLDDDFSNQIVLNDYYSSVTDSFQRGRILYPLSNLSVGKHKIWVKVWDVQNNSSEKEICFTVEDGFKVVSVKNYPNPVSSYTDFEITHTLPGDVFNARIEIFNLQGQKIDTIAETISSSGTNTITMRWDVSQSDCPVYRDQLLVYVVSLESQNNQNAVGNGKMLFKTKN